jgi:hypothetical protein
MTAYSICIPRIFENISNKKIVGTFERLKIGKVDHLDIVWKTSRDGSSYKMAFIHFNEWNMNSSAAIKLREDIENPNVEAKVIYDDPWYWIVLPNHSRVAEPTSNNPIQNMLNMPKEWLERITSLEDQLSYIYEELYQREYIPVKYRRECNWDTDIETGPIEPSNSINKNMYSPNMSPMTLAELHVHDEKELHTPASSKMAVVRPYVVTPTCYSANNDYQQKDIDYEYYDTELNQPHKLARIGSKIDHTSYNDYNEDNEYDLSTFIPLNKKLSKIWMTANYCDNA